MLLPLQKCQLNIYCAAVKKYSRKLTKLQEDINIYQYKIKPPFDYFQTQKHYALPLIRQSQDSYQPSQRQLQRQLPRSIMLVPNQLRLSEEAIQSDNPRR
ncbi:Hypothetical_protein [Hexamita inflata]|uniref:Hypothetical_protein n=1 Tax=Hexamita inflata TaxID=28002 RepID=A0AA86U611_9EUKA|nr:Hypothetical protein HINF_LOCUS26792 [Hexamita inflata]